jgi:hypothetical protein
MEKQVQNQIFPLRLPPSTRMQLEELAKADGVSMNQFICVALVEKIIRSERLLDQEQGIEDRGAPRLPSEHQNLPMLCVRSG